jgi:hypothetical protein
MMSHQAIKPWLLILFKILLVNNLQAKGSIIITSGVNSSGWGLRANGLEDDTDALQNIFNKADSSEIVFDGGEFLIHRTLLLKSGCKVVGKNGAIIKAAPVITGTLLKYGRFFYLNEVSDCSITGLRFLSENNSFQLSGWGDACVSIYNSTNSVIEDNTFQFDQKYGIVGVEAVWVSGPKTKNTLIRNNVIHGLGIKYAENGASSTIVENNKIVNAHSNALTANGNSDTMISGCKVINNYIENAGRMGIEDWGLVDGSLIEGNTVKGTGKDPAQTHEGLGISAVGINTKVNKNKIYDAHIFYLEIGGNHNITAEDNEISDISGKATGVILNFTDKLPKPLTESFSKVSGTLIENCDKAVMVFGSNDPRCAVTGNIFRNVKTRGISIEGDSPTFDIEVSDNQFIVDVPTSVFRCMINTYTNLPSGTTSQKLRVLRNKITYAKTADGGSGFDLTLLVLADHAQIVENEVIGNDIKSGGYPVYAISGNGGNALGVSITGNKIYGSVVDLKGYRQVVVNGNDFSKVVNQE